MLRPTAIACLLLLTTPQATAAIDDWVAYRSQNFVLYSDAGDRETRELLADFERFRLAALAVLGLPVEPENEHLVIVRYDRNRDFVRIRPDDGVAGFFYASVVGPRMIVGPTGRGISTERVLFHEYVHYLMSQRSDLNYPRWYAEGLADLLSSTEIRGTEIFVGEPPEGYWESISRGYNANIEDIVVPDGDIDSRFYLSSWIMSHYLLFGGDSSRRQQTIDFLRRYNAGEDPVEAFTDSYGLSPSAMNREIDRYAKRRRVSGLRLSGIEVDVDVSMRPLDPGEALHFLADVAVELDSVDGAHEYFDALDDLPADSPYRIRLAGREAIALIHEQRVEEGDDLIETVIASGSEHAEVLADIAHYAYDRFVAAAEDDRELFVRHLERSIVYGERAVAADARNTEALYYLGLAYEEAGRLQEAVDTLLDAYDIDASPPQLNLDLARMLVKGSRPDLARHLLLRVYSATHSAEHRAAIRNLIDDIDDGGGVDVAPFGEL